MLVIINSFQELKFCYFTLQIHTMMSSIAFSDAGNIFVWLLLWFWEITIKTLSTYVDT